MGDSQHGPKCVTWYTRSDTQIPVLMRNFTGDVNHPTPHRNAMPVRDFLHQKSVRANSPSKCRSVIRKTALERVRSSRSGRTSLLQARGITSSLLNPLELIIAFLPLHQAFVDFCRRALCSEVVCMRHNRYVRATHAVSCALALCLAEICGGGGVSQSQSCRLFPRRQFSP